jgi:hypothetical protein
LSTADPVSLRGGAPLRDGAPPQALSFAAAARAVAALALTLAASSCASTDDPVRASFERPPAPPLETGVQLEADRPVAARDALPRATDPELAIVGGRAVHTSEVLASLRQRDAALLNYHLNLLVGERLAEIDAERLGLAIAQSEVDARARTYEDDFTAQLEGGSLNDFLRDELGVEPRAFRRRLVTEARRELLAERVVRAWTLSQETARVRIAVVGAESVAEVRRRHEAGEDFADVARALSLDPTAANGGLVSYVVRSERSRLGRLAFRTQLGELGGPVEIDPERGVQLLFVVEELRAPLAGSWAEVGDVVDAALVQSQVSDEEFLQWQVAAERRTPVDLTPISALLDEDLR